MIGSPKLKVYQSDQRNVYSIEGTRDDLMLLAAAALEAARTGHGAVGYIDRREPERFYVEFIPVRKDG